MFEAVGESPAIDVEGFENLADGLEGDVPVETPEDNVEVFLPGGQAVEDAVEKKGVVLETTLEQAEVAAIQFDPELGALQMLQPACSQIAPPVFLDPLANRVFPQVVTDFLALNPFVALGFFFAFGVNATHFHGLNPLSVHSQISGLTWRTVQC